MSSNNLPEIEAVRLRIRKLAQRDDIANTARAVLGVLSRQTSFTDDHLWF